MSAITAPVLQTMLSRLADPTYGYNARLIIYAPDYGIQVADLPTIEFPDQTTTDFTINDTRSSQYQQFFMTSMDAMAVAKEVNSDRFPIMTMFGATSQNLNLEKYSSFSGRITVQMDMVMSWGTLTAATNSEAYINLIEQAIFWAMNDAPGMYGLGHISGVSEWPCVMGGPAYNGNLQMTRGRAIAGSKAYIQPISFTLMCELDANA